MNIGVFDSGIGGQAVAESLRRAFPAAEVTVADDKAHVPYGSRPLDEIVALTDTAIRPLLGCDVVVLACNTATAAAIEPLRAKYPHMSFVGLEPMLKPAVRLSTTGVIAVCATPATLASERYLQLKRRYAAGVTVLEPDCSDWAHMIESKRINAEHIKAAIEDVCRRGADVITLACTHYHWIEEEIRAAAKGRATIIQPSGAVARQVAKIIEKK